METSWAPEVHDVVRFKSSDTPRMTVVEPLKGTAVHVMWWDRQFMKARDGWFTLNILKPVVPQ